MTNEKALKALQQIKTYCSATQLDELEYVISVLEKLEKDGYLSGSTEQSEE